MCVRLTRWADDAGAPPVHARAIEHATAISVAEILRRDVTLDMSGAELRTQGPRKLVCPVDRGGGHHVYLILAQTLNVDRGCSAFDLCVVKPRRAQSTQKKMLAGPP